MSSFLNKVDFAVILSVKNANPNGDPLNGNRPRENYEGYGEISDVCIKRKIRNRLQDLGQDIFVQSDERRTDGFRSLKDRADGCAELKKAGKDKESYAAIACEKWMDVRSFGQVFAFKKGDEDSAVSVGIRGPVSIHSAVSVTPIEISSMQITKSVNGETGKDPDKKSPDTMGMKHRVEFGLYIFYGSINTQLAAKTGFSEEDSELIKQALITLFENDCSSARPDGSMEVCQVYWWKHSSQSGQYSSAKVHRSLKVVPKSEAEFPKSLADFDITLEPLAGLSPEIYDGL
ncbi:type I-C CRISPR-associated protein Cas7/Csd2 [Desulfitobacterium hafniense]|uniref:type I-C CRISPR-associated protein Cas7/Csd2 n=1 Tax=Desulfitobacterium hafniense TaxID=49338 RepID=UPI00035CD706|nr:type I-C CRISPR-associated protein Cas7/Csd2 [Desulfitobacterium hafniense]